jgi:hypothetical protein
VKLHLFRQDLQDYQDLFLDSYFFILSILLILSEKGLYRPFILIFRIPALRAVGSLYEPEAGARRKAPTASGSPMSSEAEFNTLCSYPTSLL